MINQRYLYMRRKASTLPTVEVTEAEFIAAVMAAGRTEEDARQIAGASKIFGSSVMVGERMLMIKE